MTASEQILSVDTAASGRPSGVGTLYVVRIADGNIDQAIWAEHNRLQPTSYSCKECLDVLQPPTDARIAQVWEDNEYGETKKLVGSYAFRLHYPFAIIEGKLFDVCNEIVDVVADAIFSRYPRVSLIKTDLAFGTLKRCRYRIAVHNQTVDHVLQLPSDLNIYHDQLGKNHVKRLSYYVRRFFRDFSDARLQVLEGAEILPELVHEIIELNRRRMSSKGRKPGIDDVYEQRILSLARCQGVVVVLATEEGICAGTILYKWADTVLLHVVAHNRKYDKYSPGLICLYSGIEHFINQRIHTYHFLWGDSDYKQNFGADAVELRAYLILRSWGSYRFAVRDIAVHQVRRVRTIARHYVSCLDRALGRLVRHEKPFRGLVARLRVIASAKQAK